MNPVEMNVNVSSEPQLHLQEIVLTSSEDDSSVNGSDSKILEKKTSWFLYFAVITMNLTFVTLGVVLVWISPVAEKLLSSDSEKNPLGRPITIVELSLVGSLSQIGMVIGPLLLERVFDKFGSKRSLNIINLLVVLSLVGLSFSTHIILYYALILIIGILLGGTNVGLPVYIGAITENHNRAKMSCLMGLFMPIGNLYGFILGSFFSVKTFTLLSSLPSLILVILSELFLPESPAYLISKGDKTTALKGLNKLLGNNSKLVEQVAKKIVYTHNVESNQTNFKILWSDKATRKGVIISCTLMILTVATGLPPVMSYLEPIFKEAGADVSSSTYVIVVGLVQIVCFLAASSLVEKLGRRFLLLISAASTTIPLLTLGLYFNTSTMLSDLTWLPVIGITVLMVTSIIGICSVALAYMNEVFTSNIKATAISFIYFISGIIISLVIFLFPIGMSTIGLSWIFWLFCFFNVLGFVFIYYYVPETKGKNVFEIQEVMRK